MNSIGFDLQESLHLLLLLLFQVVEDGYEFFAKRQLVTLFSAPNYCGEFDNAGGMMSVDDSLMCSFQVGGERYSLFSLLIFVCYGTVELDISLCSKLCVHHCCKTVMDLSLMLREVQ